MRRLNKQSHHLINNLVPIRRKTITSLLCLFETVNEKGGLVVFIDIAKKKQHVIKFKFT